MLAIVIIACQNRETKEVEVSTKIFRLDENKHEIDSMLIDENDTAFVVKNKVDAKDVGTSRALYEINILFSNKKLPILYFKNAIGADLYIVGDLDGDNKPELLLRPEWFNNCWSSVNLFSLKDNAWHLINRGGMYFCNDKYPLSNRIEKQDDRYYLVTDSIVNEKFVIEKKEIKF
jgi:hypothetical protein